MSIPIKTLTLPISSGGSTTETEYSFITPDDMDQKANVDGYYENLVSGGSEQLLSSVYEEDSEPYLFRTSGGSMDIGDREEDTIVGGTIAFNQLCPIPSNDQSGTRPYGSVVTDNRDGTYVVTASAPLTGVDYVWIRGKSSIPNYIKSNHVYLQTSNSQSTNIGGTQFVLYGSPSIAYYEENQKIFKTGNVNDYAEYAFVLYFKKDSQPDNVKLSPCLFDLTQMFGSTIADYVLALEQTTAGAGVAWFKKLFPKPYYAYNEGELLSVEGLQSHDMVGFNAWDEVYENGGYSTSTGEAVANSAYLRSKNFIPVVSGATYYRGIGYQSDFRVFYYDADKNYIDSVAMSSAGTFTIPSGIKYIKFHRNGATYANNICINLSWDGERDGEYEPYVKHSYPLDDSLTLKGIPKLDANNKLYYDGDIYEADGTVTRKYGVITIDGVNETVSYNGTAGGCSKAYKAITGRATNGNVLAVGFTTWTPSGSHVLVPYDVLARTNGNGLEFQLPESVGSAVGTWFAEHPTTVVYELATPTTEQAEPYQTPQIVADFGTEEYVTDSIVPVGHVTKYMPNLKAKLEMAPDSPSDNGDYIVRHTNGQNEYVPLVIPAELPTTPLEDGTYHLKVTVTNGTAVLSWEGE